MPSSPEHLSDRCLYMVLFLHFCPILFRLTGTIFRGGGNGFYPGPVFQGGVFYFGETRAMLQHQENLFKQNKGVGVLTEKI